MNNNKEIAYKLVNLINSAEHKAAPFHGGPGTVAEFYVKGEDCLSVALPSNCVEEFFADLLDVAIEGDDLAVVQDDIATIISAMRMAHTDDTGDTEFGTDIVIYWPRLPFVQD